MSDALSARRRTEPPRSRGGGSSGFDALDARQRALVGAWMPGAVVDADLGWGLIATTVLRVRAADGGLCGVKAGGPSDHHIAREIRAHQSWLAPWVRAGRAPALLRHDTDARVLVTRRLPGRLVLGDPAADDAAVFAQAGDLLAKLHAVESRRDAAYEARENERMYRWLASPPRIAAADAARWSATVDGWPEPPPSRSGTRRSSARGWPSSRRSSPTRDGPFLGAGSAGHLTTPAAPAASVCRVPGAGSRVRPTW